MPQASAQKYATPHALLPMIFFTVVINYMDRTNVAVAAPAIQAELDLSPSQMGLVFSAFAWTYSALQIPGGLIVDKMRARILYPVLLMGWSIATVAHATVNSVAGLVGLRAIIGVFEAPSFPLNNRIVTEWFAPEKRAGAIAFYTSGQFLGLALLVPMLVAVQDYFGWRGLFVVTGIVGIGWALVWYAVYRDPESTPDGSNTVEPRNAPQPQRCAPVSIVWSSRNLIGIYLGQFCLGTLTIFFLTWFPSYLVDYRGVEFAQSGWLAAIPFLAAFCGVLLSGQVSDWLVRRGHSAAFARKTPVLTGMVLSTIIIAANFTDDTGLVIVFLSIAFFGNGLASIAWVFVSLMAPRGHIGLVGGIFNFCGALSAIVTPIAIGLLIDGTDFAPALFYIGFFTVLGALSYLFLVRDVRPVDAHLREAGVCD